MKFILSLFFVLLSELFYGQSTTLKTFVGVYVKGDTSSADYSLLMINKDSAYVKREYYRDAIFRQSGTWSIIKDKIQLTPDTLYWINGRSLPFYLFYKFDKKTNTYKLYLDKSQLRKNINYYRKIN